MNLTTLREPSASVNFWGTGVRPAETPSEVRISRCPGALVHPEQTLDA